MTNPDDVFLYILLRTDLPSMNPGKGAAQSTHAANQCIFEARQRGNFQLLGLVSDWENQTGKGFGTTIVLGVTEEQMNSSVTAAKAAFVHANVTHDPTYPMPRPYKDTKTPVCIALLLVCVALAAVSFAPHMSQETSVGFLYSAIFLGLIAFVIDIINGNQKKVNDRIPFVAPMDTCAYIFGDKNIVRPFMTNLYLHR